MNKMVKFFKGHVWLFALLCVLSVKTTAQEIEAPPLVSIIDANGVNLATGKFKLPGLDIGIGTSESGLFRITNEKSDNLTGKLYFNFVQMTGDGGGLLNMNATLGGQTYSFRVGGGYGASAAPSSSIARPYKLEMSLSNKSDSATLNCTGNLAQFYSGGICTLTLSDGTRAIYGYSNNSASQSGRWFLQNINKPDGEVISYTYYTSGSLIKEIKSVSTSLGWMLKYEVDTNYVITKITAINISDVYCSPDASSCSVPSGYPNVTATKSGSTTTIKRNGTTIVTYTESGNVVTVSTPSGTTKTVTYSGGSPNRVVSVSVGSSTWAYSYDTDYSSNITTTVTNPDNSKRTVEASSGGTIISENNEAGKSTRYYYESGTGQLERISVTDSPYTRFYYDDRQNLERKEVHPTGGGTALITTYEYPTVCSNIKTCNKPERIIHPNGQIVDYTYYSHGGIETRTTYANLSMLPIEVRYHYTQYTPHIRNSAGSLVAQPTVWRLTSTSSCMTAYGNSCVGTVDERVTGQSYSGNNNILPNQTILKRGDNSHAQATVRSYDIYGQLQSIDGPKAGSVDKVYFYYDALGRQRGTIGGDPDGAGSRNRPTKRIQYDSSGRAYKVETGLATGADSSTYLDNMSVLAYTQEAYSSSHGLPITTRVYENGSLTELYQTSYDSSLRPLCKAQRLNPAVFGTITSTSACSLGDAGPDGNDRITYFTYTTDSRIRTVTSAYGTPLARKEFTRTFNIDGTLDSERDAKGNITKHFYDGFNRITETCYANPTSGSSYNSADCREIEYTYNGEINKLILRNQQEIYYDFDLLGRVTGKSGAVSESFTYNNFNNVISHTNNGVTESRTYNSIGWLLSHTQQMGSVSYDYYAHGTRKKLIYPDGFYAEYFYNDGDELTSISASSGGASVGFQYDSRGRRSAITRSNGRSTSYGYETIRNRLQTINHSSVNAITLGYSQTNQISSKTNSSATYNYDPVVTPYTIYENDGLNRIKKVSSTSLLYDGLGNMTRDEGNNTYSYNAKSLMTSAVLGGVTATLSYDATDRLLSITKSGSTTKFLYDGVDLIAEYSSSGTILRRYIHGAGLDEPLLWYEGSGTSSPRFLHADQQGSVIAVTSGSGSVLNSVTYDAYGNKTSSNSSYESRFSFTGQIWLKEIGMYYYKARMYNQKLGRFMQTDPIGYADGLNWYAYLGNDPVNLRDPFGLKKNSSAGCDSDHHYTCNSLDNDTRAWLENCRNEGRNCSADRVVGQGSTGSNAVELRMMMLANSMFRYFTSDSGSSSYWLTSAQAVTTFNYFYTGSPLIPSEGDVGSLGLELATDLIITASEIDGITDAVAYFGPGGVVKPSIWTIVGRFFRGEYKELRKPKTFEEKLNGFGGAARNGAAATHRADFNYLYGT